MKLFQRLFGEKGPPPVETRGECSILRIMLQAGNAQVKTATCSIDKTTFPLPSSQVIFANLPNGGFTIDVGGYCQVCAGNRCPGHTMLVEVPAELWDMLGGGQEAVDRLQKAIKDGKMRTQWVLGCRKCGNPYGISNKKAAEFLRTLQELLRHTVKMESL